MNTILFILLFSLPLLPVAILLYLIHRNKRIIDTSHCIKQWYSFLHEIEIIIRDNMLSSSNQIDLPALAGLMAYRDVLNKESRVDNSVRESKNITKYKKEIITKFGKHLQHGQIINEWKSQFREDKLKSLGI